MQLADIIGSVRRHWRVSVAFLLLAAVGLGIFLFTRKEVRGEDRFASSVLLLVPVRGKDAVIPAGVPPELLQGQAQLALSNSTTRAALRRAGIADEDRESVLFDFKTNFVPKTDTTSDDSGGRGDILTLTTTAGSKEQATRLSDAYANAYINARRLVVAQSDQIDERFPVRGSGETPAGPAVTTGQPDRRSPRARGAQPTVLLEPSDTASTCRLSS